VTAVAGDPYGMGEPHRCRICHDVIGAYEPIVMFERDRRRITSLAWEGFAIRADVELAHYDCAPAALEEEEAAPARDPELELSGL
jgi:hypothetical protein